jgi:hypothetical protein
MIRLATFIMLGVLLASPCAAEDSSAPAARERWLALARPLWEARLAKTGGHHAESSAYPTEPSLVFLTAYDLTRDTRYAEQAARQLDYAHRRATDDGLLLTADGLCGRDYQARQVYNFYVAYRVLADGRYLRWADEAAAAMLKHVPRTPHASRNEAHTLFSADLFDRHGAVRLSNTQRIDPNQNAGVALAFSLLYHDPASAMFQSAVAKSIAYEELLAAMSVQDMTTGEIPITEHIAAADTAYGAYAASSWTWCQLLWREPRFEPHVRAAGRWLGTKTDLTRDCTRVYPKSEQTCVPSWQANYCLPLFWYCGIDAGKFIADLRERTAHPEQTPGDDPAPLYWAYFDAMGVPREFYLDGRLSSRWSDSD